VATREALPPGSWKGERVTITTGAVPVAEAVERMVDLRSEADSDIPMLAKGEDAKRTGPSLARDSSRP
jgi:hypothetical protein